MSISYWSNATTFEKYFSLGKHKLEPKKRSKTTKTRRTGLPYCSFQIDENRSQGVTHVEVESFRPKSEICLLSRFLKLLTDLI